MQVGALKRTTPKRATTHTLTTNSTKSVLTNTKALACCHCISERESTHTTTLSWRATVRNVFELCVQKKNNFNKPLKQKYLSISRILKLSLKTVVLIFITESKILNKTYRCELISLIPVISFWLDYFILLRT